HAFQDLRILARNDLGDPFQCVLAVARVDPFRRIAEPKISSALQSRYLLKYRPANFLRCTGIDRRFVDYDRTLGEGGADRARGADERTEIWPSFSVDGCGNADDEERAVLEVGGSSAKADRRGGQFLRSGLPRPIVTAREIGDAPLVDVKPNRPAGLPSNPDATRQPAKPRANYAKFSRHWG